MLRCFRKLAKPVTCLSLIGFVGQFLLIYCVIGAADATTINAAADTRAQPTHYHGAAQHTTQHNIDTTVSADNAPCCCKHDHLSQKKESCCDVGSIDQPFLSEASRELIDDNLQQADFVALLTDPVQVPERTPICDIPLKPGFERTRFSTPTYLANCSFLE